MTHYTPKEAREIAKYFPTRSDTRLALRSLANQVEALTAERDALQADAARYRWLKRSSPGYIVIVEFGEYEEYQNVLTENDADDAIDGAMKEPK